MFAFAWKKVHDNAAPVEAAVRDALVRQRDIWRQTANEGRLSAQVSFGSTREIDGAWPCREVREICHEPSQNALLGARRWGDRTGACSRRGPRSARPAPPSLFGRADECPCAPPDAPPIRRPGPYPEPDPKYKAARGAPRAMGVVARGAKCNVDGCGEGGARSINTTRVENAGLRITGAGKKSVLCKAHYKEYKKESKDDRDLERARYDRF